MNFNKIITKYSLQKHPEGGYFCETYRSKSSLLSPINGKERASVTDIYYMLTQGETSRFHKVIHDEIWHFYEGSPLKLFKYDGKCISEYTIGPNCDDGYKVVIEAGMYQAAITTGEYSLMGCTVAPGFDFNDFSFLSDDVEAANEFKNSFPSHKYLI